eukprot:TRINITY_DN4175_c0_g1_i4.p1 TRINITY_DN4175_c0_g1~~TRINITY_DN4175_c0_g1_i4.p1  ORF type:complete len:561 (+),score=133.58 TRINITY_DN4175_c0_g1_i4:96-1685(+)
MCIRDRYLHGPPTESQDENSNSVLQRKAISKKKASVIDWLKSIQPDFQRRNQVASRPSMTSARSALDDLQRSRKKGLSFEPRPKELDNHSFASPRGSVQDDLLLDGRFDFESDNDQLDEQIAAPRIEKFNPSLFRQMSSKKDYNSEPFEANEQKPSNGFSYGNKGESHQRNANEFEDYSSIQLKERSINQEQGQRTMFNDEYEERLTNFKDPFFTGETKSFDPVFGSNVEMKSKYSAKKSVASKYPEEQLLNPFDSQNMHSHHGGVKYSTRKMPPNTQFATEAQNYGGSYMGNGNNFGQQYQSDNMNRGPKYSTKKAPSSNWGMDQASEFDQFMNQQQNLIVSYQEQGNPYMGNQMSYNENSNSFGNNFDFGMSGSKKASQAKFSVHKASVNRAYLDRQPNGLNQGYMQQDMFDGFIPQRNQQGMHENWMQGGMNYGLKSVPKLASTSKDMQMHQRAEYRKEYWGLEEMNPSNGYYGQSQQQPGPLHTGMNHRPQQEASFFAMNHLDFHDRQQAAPNSRQFYYLSLIHI